MATRRWIGTSKNRIRALTDLKILWINLGDIEDKDADDMKHGEAKDDFRTDGGERATPVLKSSRNRARLVPK